MNKKGQISVEFVIVVGFILILAIFFANSVFGTTDINKAVTKVKLRTLELFSTSDSRAELTRVVYVINDTNLRLDLYINKHGEDFNDFNDHFQENYELTLDSLKKSTTFENIDLVLVPYN